VTAKSERGSSTMMVQAGSRGDKMQVDATIFKEQS